MLLTVYHRINSEFNNTSQSENGYRDRLPVDLLLILKFNRNKELAQAVDVMMPQAETANIW